MHTTSTTGTARADAIRPADIASRTGRHLSCWSRRAAAVLVAAATGALLVQPATADPTRSAPALTARAGTSGSIVFIKGRNVWIADGAGARAHALTHDGTRRSPYVSPSQSDGGTIVAGHGPFIVRMDQHGRKLNRVDPPALVDTAGERMDGAVDDVAVSPNGRLVAWSFVRYSCPIGADCLVRYATGYTPAYRYQRAGRPTYYRAPSWVGNHRTLQTGGSGSQVMIHDLRATPRHWFDDSDMNLPSTDLADGELSPDGRWLAEIRGYGAGATIAWYAVTGVATSGAPPAPPTYRCVTNPGRRHASPTWSPDSTAIAWASADGIVVQRSATTCGASTPARLIVRAASAPDWSPAELRP